LAALAEADVVVFHQNKFGHQCALLANLGHVGLSAPDVVQWTLLVALVERFGVHFLFFGYLVSVFRETHVGRVIFAYASVSLSEKIVCVIVFVVLLHSVRINVFVIDDVGSHAFGIESILAVRILIDTRIRFELSGVTRIGSLAQVTLLFECGHERVKLASASILWFRADPILLADVIFVVAWFHEDHATLTLEFVFDFS